MSQYIYSVTVVLKTTAYVDPEALVEGFIEEGRRVFTEPEIVSVTVEDSDLLDIWEEDPK